MVKVEGGRFPMGSKSNRAFSNEQPVHRVRVDSFFIGKFTVTQDQYRELMGRNPSYFFSGHNSGKRPVERISWYDAVKFCNALSRRETRQEAYTIKGNSVSVNWESDGCRLPTEAEWEYAARGGVKSRGYTYAGSNNPKEVAWYQGYEGEPTQPLGGKQPNELGLYDMSGNVYEWCWDWYDGSYYESSPTVNPRGPDSGSARVFRGGSIDNILIWTTYRGCNTPTGRRKYYGFRILIPA